MQVKNKLKNNSFFSSVFKVGSGQLIAQIISTVTVPILSRIYDETAYGDYGFVLSTATLIMNFSLLGLSSAIMKPEKENEAKKVFTAAFLLNFIICSAVAVVGIAFQKTITLFVVSQNYTTTVLLMWLYMIVFNSSQLQTVYINRCGNYNKLFFNPLIGAISNIIIAVPLGFVGFGLFGFLIASIINYLIICVYLYIGYNPFMPQFRLRDIIAVCRTYKEYIVYQYPANFINNFAIEYPTQFLGRTFSTALLGPYSMCLKVLKMPIRLVAAPVSTVYFRTATELNREGKNLASFTYKFVHKVFVYSIVPVMICDFFAEEIFSFALGRTWATAGGLARILSVQYALLFCSQCVSYCRVAIGKQKANLLYSVLHLLFVWCGCFVGYKLFGNLTGTVLAFSITQSLNYIFDMALNFYYLDRKVMLKYIIEAFGYSIVIYICILLKIKSVI